jgi:hypothetical protein
MLLRIWGYVRIVPERSENTIGARPIRAPAATYSSGY